MNPMNKFEAAGIFASVAVMALALAVVRFNTDTFAKISLDGAANVASVVAVQNEDSTKDAIVNSVGLDGELKKLVIDDIKVGIGQSVTNGNTVRVHYVGTLRDGSKFDDSYVRGEPYTFEVGGGKVIKGWDQGLIGMQVGGERILVIPPELAYGNRQVGPIPANSPLIFKIELVGIE
jgi:FKBP-type peptidyl-prolyl cis-trans isomerase